VTWGADPVSRAATNALRRIAKNTHSSATRLALRDLRRLRKPLGSQAPPLDRLYAETIRVIEENTVGSIALPLPASPGADQELPIAADPADPAPDALPRVAERNPERQ